MSAQPPKQQALKILLVGSFGELQLAISCNPPALSAPSPVSECNDCIPGVGKTNELRVLLNKKGFDECTPPALNPEFASLR